MKKLNLAGVRFGKLVAKKEISKTNSGGIVWECLCDCGNIIQRTASGLSSNRTKSCGCRRVKHGLSYSSEYNAWVGIKQRCFNQNNKFYKDYGGRGISICEDWFLFENFYKDMGKKPDGTSIDRINNDGDYEPSNCRWATSREQAVNKRSNRIILYKGIKYTVNQLAEKLKVNYSTLYDRYFRSVNSISVADKE